jgi:hypothetical protein
MRHEADWWLTGWLVGLVVGLILGFTYTRLVPRPVTPDRLSREDQELYIVLVAATYRYDKDLAKAEPRLARLKDRNIKQTVIDLAETYIATSADVRDIRSLAALSLGLGQSAGFLQVYLLTPTPTPGPTPTQSPTATPTPSLTATISPTPQATVTSTPEPSVRPTFTPRTTLTPPSDPGFQLAQSVALCDNTANGVLRIYVRDQAGNGIPGVEVIVSWSGGQDHFFTGLKSDLDAGYADFQMVRDQTYQVELNGLPAAVASDVNQAVVARCPDLPVNIAPSWQIVFQEQAGS